MNKSIIVLALSLSLNHAVAAEQAKSEVKPEVAANAKVEIDKDFDSLGGNSVFLEKAKALNPEIKTSIVQERLVNRNRRIELAPEVSGTFGGDTYSKSTTLGLNLNFHINPYFSIGAKYGKSFNKLTAEGDALVEKATADYLKNPKASNSPIPDLDYPLAEQMATISWYPIYGKMKWLENSVAHFDIYALMGAGQVTLKTGTANSQTAGLGVGIWASQNISTRLELRYQKYQAKYYTGPVDLDLAVASAQVGWML